MAWLTHEVQRGTEPVAAEQAHVAILEGQKMRVRLGGEGWPATGTLDVPAAGGMDGGHRTAFVGGGGGRAAARVFGGESSAIGWVITGGKVQRAGAAAGEKRYALVSVLRNGRAAAMVRGPMAIFLPNFFLPSLCSLGV
jgi:hypothetical protein